MAVFFLSSFFLAHFIALLKTNPWPKIREIICWFYPSRSSSSKSSFHLLRLHLCYYFSYTHIFFFSFLWVAGWLAGLLAWLVDWYEARNFKALNDGLKMIYKSCVYLFVNLQLSMWISLFVDHMLISNNRVVHCVEPSTYYYTIRTNEMTYIH